MGCQLRSTVSQQLLWEPPARHLGSLAPVALLLEAQQPPPSGQTIIPSPPSLCQGPPEPWDWFGPAVCSELVRPPELLPWPSSPALIWPCWPPATPPAGHLPKGLYTCLLCPNFSHLFLVLAPSPVPGREETKPRVLQLPALSSLRLLSCLLLYSLSECP